MRATLSLPLVGIVLALPLVAYTALNGYAGTRLDVLLLYDALLRRHQHVPSLTIQSAVQPARATAASTGGTWSLAWSREGLSASWEEGGAQPVPLLQTAPGAAFVAAASSERVAAEAGKRRGKVADQRTTSTTNNVFTHYNSMLKMHFYGRSKRILCCM